MELASTRAAASTPAWRSAASTTSVLHVAGQQAEWDGLELGPADRRARRLCVLGHEEVALLIDRCGDDRAERFVVEVGDAGVEVVVGESSSDFDRGQRSDLDADAGVALEQRAGDQRHDAECGWNHPEVKRSGQVVTQAGASAASPSRPASACCAHGSSARPSGARPTWRCWRLTSATPSHVRARGSLPRARAGRRDRLGRRAECRSRASAVRYSSWRRNTRRAPAVSRARPACPAPRRGSLAGAVGVRAGAREPAARPRSGTHRGSGARRTSTRGSRACRRRSEPAPTSDQPEMCGVMPWWGIVRQGWSAGAGWGNQTSPA